MGGGGGGGTDPLVLCFKKHLSLIRVNEYNKGDHGISVKYGLSSFEIKTINVYFFGYLPLLWPGSRQNCRNVQKSFHRLPS